MNLNAKLDFYVVAVGLAIPNEAINRIAELREHTARAKQVRAYPETQEQMDSFRSWKLGTS